MKKRALFLCAGLIISVAAMFGQELPILKVTEREMNMSVPVFRCAGDNETVVEVQSYLFLTFESTMDKTVNFCDMKQENGFYVYKLLFPTGEKYKGRKLKIKSSGFDTYTQPLLDLKAKIPIGLLVFNGTKSIADDLFNQGKFTEALKEYEKLYSINPNDAYIKDRIDICSKGIANNKVVQKGNDENSQKADRILLKDSSVQQTNDTKRIADDLYNEGKFNEALKEYERLLSINPNDEYAKLRINQCNEKLGNDNEKSAYSAITWFREGEKNSKAGNYSEAIQCYHKALDKNPNMSDAWYNLGIACGREKKKSEALECYQKAAQLGNKNAQRLLTLMGKK